MKGTYFVNRGVLIAIIFILLMVPLLHGQGFNYEDLTRGKLWARIWNTSAVGQPTLGGGEYYKFDYPGHLLGADLDDHYGMCEWSGYIVWADVDGVGTPFRVCMALYGIRIPRISPLRLMQR